MASLSGTYPRDNYPVSAEPAPVGLTDRTSAISSQAKALVGKLAVALGRVEPNELTAKNPSDSGKGAEHLVWSLNETAESLAYAHELVDKILARL